MKTKSNVHILPFIIVVMAFASCTHNQLDEQEDKIALQFEVMVQPNTKQEKPEGEYPLDGAFGVWAFDEDGSVYLDNSRVNFNDGKWGPSGGETWPESKLSFEAYSPFGRASYDERLGVFFEDYDIAENLDIMYSDTIADQDKDRAQGRVSVMLQRALCLVRFSARATLLDYGQLHIKKITLDDVYAKGDFRSNPKAIWELDEDKRSFCFFEGDTVLGEDAISIGEQLYMIPQDNNVRVSILCDIVSGDVILRDQVLSTQTEIAWKTGKLAAYVLKVDAKLNLRIEKDNK